MLYKEAKQLGFDTTQHCTRPLLANIHYHIVSRGYEPMRPRMCTTCTFYRMCTLYMYIHSIERVMLYMSIPWNTHHSICASAFYRMACYLGVMHARMHGTYCIVGLQFNKHYYGPMYQNLLIPLHSYINFLIQTYLINRNIAGIQAITHSGNRPRIEQVTMHIVSSHCALL